MTAPDEEWRPIDGFPDYVVSSEGRVASIKRGQVRILSGGRNPMGYRNVLLYNAGQRSMHRVHVLVARAFQGPRPEGMEIRHLDGDQINNAVSNIRYGTREENLVDQRLHRGKLLIVGPDPFVRAPVGISLKCPEGHDRKPTNTRFYRDGRVQCRTCHRAYKSLRAAGISSSAVAA